MSVFFISDLHLGHKNILNFSPCRFGRNIDEHDEWIVSQWNSVVNKKDLVYVLGDVCFSGDKLNLFREMNGNKILIRGNHDRFQTSLYLKFFSQVYGIIKKYDFWISHAPIHPQELRGKRNIHGHVHSNSIPDERYINVSVEALNAVPVSLEDLRKKCCNER